MNKPVLFFVLALLGVLLGLACAVTGVVLRKKLPPLAFVLMLSCGVVAAMMLGAYAIPLGWVVWMAG